MTIRCRRDDDGHFDRTFFNVVAYRGLGLCKYTSHYRDRGPVGYYFN